MPRRRKNRTNDIDELVSAGRRRGYVTEDEIEEASGGDPAIEEPAEETLLNSDVEIVEDDEEGVSPF